MRTEPFQCFGKPLKDLLRVLCLVEHHFSRSLEGVGMAALHGTLVDVLGMVRHFDIHSEESEGKNALATESYRLAGGPFLP